MHLDLAKTPSSLICDTIFSSLGVHSGEADSILKSKIHWFKQVVSDRHYIVVFVAFGYSMSFRTIRNENRGQD